MTSWPFADLSHIGFQNIDPSATMNSDRLRYLSVLFPLSRPSTGS